uniref:Ribulose bisphosphate carboxylase small subunit, chloroplastic n=1 Tax=Chlorella sp. ArM0029B TaxID=1415603 RepID=A0A345AXC8_9CHLO|nr:rbcS3 protein [Chlorella sp. ArM0029B]
MACTIAAIAPVAARPVVAAPLKQAKNTFAARTVSNGSIKKTTAMQVWTPINNKMFETFSFLPPLTDAEISRQVDYIVRNGWTPCLEFAGANEAYASNDSCSRMVGSGKVLYYDNRYWTMWKLPMFGCTDGNQVLAEVQNCRRAFPEAYIRMCGFDSVRQVQIAGFLVSRPSSVRDYQSPSSRSV